MLQINDIVYDTIIPHNITKYKISEIVVHNGEYIYMAFGERPDEWLCFNNDAIDKTIATTYQKALDMAGPQC